MDILFGSLATVIGSGVQWFFSTIAGSLHERKRISKIANRVIFYMHQIWFPMYRIRHFDSYWREVWEKLSKGNEEAVGPFKEAARLSVFQILISFKTDHLALDDTSLDKLNSLIQDLAEDFPFDALEITNSLKMLNYQAHWLKNFTAPLAEAFAHSSQEGVNLLLSRLNSITAAITDEQLSDLESKMNQLSRYTSRSTRRIYKKRMKSSKEIDTDTVDRMTNHIKETLFRSPDSENSNQPGQDTES
jgi:hypothetical protein